jgi:hypothetical protein
MMISARIRARKILSWVFRNYQIEAEFSLRQFYWRYLAHQMKTLCVIKKRAENIHILSSNDKSIAEEVRVNIAKCFAGIDEFWECWKAIPASMENLSWSLKETFRVSVKQVNISDLIDLGKCINSYYLILY